MKICGVCKISKEESDFAYKNKKTGKLQYQCRKCQKEYRDNHYIKNKQKYIDKASKWRKNARIEFYNWLRTKKCIDCGNDDFRVLEFDHLKNKSYNIATKIGFVSFKELKKEIQKCDIVCSNCHKIRTAIRQDQYKYLRY